MNLQRPDSLEVVLLPRAHDLGGFEVRRALPARERQMVGPFIFFDQMGPGEFLAGRGLDVRPHPHIGLATVTYLFEGEILHRDSLGSRQPIVPGDVNWMTAGRGIAHSERTGQASRNHANRLFGIQSWVALPKTAEEAAPGFVHHPGATLPEVEDRGLRLRLIAGAAGASRRPWQSPRRCSTPTRFWRPVQQCHCRKSTTSGPPTWCRARSMWRGTDSHQATCSYSVPAIGWLCMPDHKAPECCFWVGQRWMGHVICSGISSPPAASGSNRPRPTGAPAA